MGDRLTLETADERKAWLELMAETCSTREADAAIRAYRERLPASDDAPQNTGGFGGTHLVLPPDWVLDTTSAGEWRVTDTGETSRVIMGPDAEELARRAWEHWTRAERGPTEGASDADIDARKVLLALADEMESECDSFDEWGARVRGCALSMPERPPTGEASPGVDFATEVKLIESLAEYVGTIDPSRCDLWTAVKLTIADALIPWGSAVYQRDEAQAKLGTLIGAVEGVASACESGMDTTPSSRRVAKRLRSIADAAKGDAPTATPSPTTPAPQVPDSPPVQHAVVTHVGETPMMPDAEGVWVRGGAPVLVERKAGMGGLSWRDIETKLWRPVLDGADWGGRCTRDAPDDGLRARVEDARRTLVAGLEAASACSDTARAGALIEAEALLRRAINA